MPRTADEITRARAAGYTAARKVCAARWPDVAFAAHLLPRGDRHALFVTLAVLEQLREIVWSDDDNPCADSAPSAAPVTPDATSACATCTGGTCEQRKAVTAAVLDALFAGETTGRADLDAFAAVAQQRQLDRSLFDQTVQGWLTEQSIRRVATWARFRELTRDGWGQGGWLLLAAVAGDEGLTLPPHVREQVTAWFAAARWTGALYQIAACHKRGQLLVPLDDLIRCGLSEPAVAQVVAQPNLLREDERWRVFMTNATDRAVNLLRGGEAALPHLPASARKLLAASHGQLIGRWKNIERDPTLIFSPKAATSLGWRLRRLPAIWRCLAAAGGI